MFSRGSRAKARAEGQGQEPPPYQVAVPVAVYAPPGMTLLPVPVAQAEKVSRQVQVRSKRWRERPWAYRLPSSVATPGGIVITLLVGLVGEIKKTDIRIILIVAACLAGIWLVLALLGAALSRHADRQLAKPSKQVTLK